MIIGSFKKVGEGYEGEIVTLTRLCCTIPAIGRAAIFEGFSYATGCVRWIPRAVKRLRPAIRT